MRAKIAKTENAIKIDGEFGQVRVILDIIKGDEDILTLFHSLIGTEFEITINGHDDTQTHIRYYG